jgi:hypothetical protein
MLAAPILIDRSMTNCCAGVSGKDGGHKKINGQLSPRSGTNIYHLPASRPTLFFIGHYLKGKAFFKSPDGPTPHLQLANIGKSSTGQT